PVRRPAVDCRAKLITAPQCADTTLQGRSVMVKWMRVPHTLTLLFSMMLLAMVATWIVPQGFFETQTLANGRSAVVPGTFALVEERQYLSPWQLLTAIPRAFASAQDVIFFVMILGGVLSIARATGTVDA